MFQYCNSLSTIPLLDNSNVNDMNDIFEDCFSLSIKKQVEFFYQKDKLLIKSIEMGIMKEDKMNELLKEQNIVFS
jgi:hypothetical protein